MRARSTTVAVLAFLVLAPAVCSAQQLPPEVLTRRHQELTRWLAAYEAWESWYGRWANKIAYNAAGGVIKKRPIRPEPPEWLPRECEELIEADGALGRACAILDAWSRSEAAPWTRSQPVPLARTDTVPKSSFLQRVHFSGGWVPAQLPAPKVYLVAGMQVGIVEVGRATLPAVGVGLMAVADGAGGYDWKPATVIGLGYRITSFGFPWVRREANLHINVARATVHGTTNMPLGLDPSQNLIGFSLTFAKR